MASKSGGAGGGRSFTQTSQQRIAALQSLGNQSDSIRKLNQRAETARQRLDILYRQAPSSKRQNAINRANEKWQATRDDLQQAYRTSQRFSHQNRITELPIPTGLQQR